MTEQLALFSDEPSQSKMSRCPCGHDSCLWERCPFGQGDWILNGRPYPPPEESGKQRMYVPLDEPVICPVCEMTWTTLTPVSWWRRYDRCYTCMRDIIGDRGRCLTAAEMRPFESREIVA